MKTAGRMNLIPFTPIRKILEEANRRENNGEEIIHLEIGRPDFDTPSHIKEAAVSALNQGKVHYSSNYGIQELRVALSEKLMEDNGLSYDPYHEIIVTVGATEGILISMMSLLDPEDEVLILSPAFPCYAQCAHMAGAVPVEVSIKQRNKYIPSIDDVKSKISSKTKMMVINTPNNPTGAVYNFKIIEQLSKISIKNDIIVLSDEIYEKNIYDGRQHVSTASIPGMKERTITLNGFSKTYSMTGWRLGYVASSPDLISALVKIRQYATVCPASFAQWGAVAALSSSQTCVEQMVEEFDKRRLMIIERLNAMPKISFVRPEGGFYVLINVSEFGKTSKEIADYLLDEAKISVVPWGTKHIRISYANSFENLEKAMDRMKETLTELC